MTEEQLLDRIKSGKLIEEPEYATERSIEGLRRTPVVSGDTELISAPAYVRAAQDAPRINLLHLGHGGRPGPPVGPMGPTPAPADVTCPWYGSARVERIGEWGPALLTEQYMCLECRSPFEWIRRR